MGDAHEKRDFQLWAIARPAADVPGQWVGHCLELDLVTMGNSLEHCFEMLREAASIVVIDDLNEGLDPLDRTDRGDPIWEEWERVMHKGTERQISKTDDKARYIWALRWGMVVELRAEDDVPTDDNSSSSIQLPEFSMVLAA